jgi:DNA primase catalytic core
MAETNLSVLKSQCDIVEVATTLNCLPKYKSGAYFKGPCPGNHESKDGQCFVLWPEIQAFRCYHCDASGDVIDLVKLAKKCGFQEAVQWLANHAGIELENQTPEQRIRYEERRVVYEILTCAAQYYHKQLLNDPEMLGHLKDHYGLNEETIKTYLLGYSPGQDLLKHLSDIGYTKEQTLLTGLFVQLEERVTEFYKHRLTFPYWKSGQVVYFIGRKTTRTPDNDWEKSKYKKLLTRTDKRPYISEHIQNSTFYGEDSIRGVDTVYVAEGVTDCLSLLQVGYATISPVTTRFRAQDQDHLIDLTKYASTVFLIPDAEENQAGIKGAMDTAGCLEAVDKSVFIINIPKPADIEKIDITDFLRDNGKEAFENLVKQAKTILQLEIDKIAGENLDLIRLSDRLGPIKSKLVAMPQSRAEGYLEYLKKELKVKASFINSIRKEIFKESKSNGKEKENQKIQYTANLPGLVEIVQTDDGPAFLILKDHELTVVNSIEDAESTHVPPPAESMKWLLPRADYVLDAYKTDKDKTLFYDLVDYHKGISELPSEDHYYLLALWDLHTYLFEKSEYSPYLWLYAIPERGKSRTGKGCIYVARRALHVESLRDAYILRVAENLGATLFFDVLELWKKAEKTGTEDILLQRYEKGTTVPRVLYPERGPHKDTVYFSVYGPTVVATNEMVSEIFATRAIQIIMPESDRQFENDVKPENGLELKERLVAFRARHLDDELPQAQKPCRYRLGDILRPLLQVLLLAVPEEKERFIRLCGRLEQERYENLADTLEARILQAIIDLKSEIEKGRLEAKKIGDKINEGVPDKFKKSQSTITRICARMGFKAKRPKGKTHIEIEPRLLEKLSMRYLRKNVQNERGYTPEKSAPSALSANNQENQDISECTSECRDSGPQNKCTSDKKKVHPATNWNYFEKARGAESAENQGVLASKKMHVFTGEKQDELCGFLNKEIIV